MKSLFLGCLVLFSFVLPVNAAGIGFIEPWEAGEIRQEFGLLQTSSDWEPQEADFNAGMATQRLIYAQAEYGINKGLAVFFRLGAADLVLEQGVIPIKITDVTSDMEGDIRPWGGLGIKGVIGGAERFSLGYFLEGRYFGNFSDETSAVVDGEPVKLVMDLKEYWSAQAGLPLQLKVFGWGLFVGPVISFSNANLELTATGAGVTDTASSIYRVESPFGVMAGLAIPLGAVGRVSLEGRFGGSNAWGAVINFAQFDY